MCKEETNIPMKNHLHEVIAQENNIEITGEQKDITGIHGHEENEKDII